MSEIVEGDPVVVLVYFIKKILQNGCLEKKRKGPVIYISGNKHVP